MTYKVFLYILPFFQRKFVTAFSVLLNTNRLPFRILNNSIKIFLFYIATPETWLLIFKRLKNNVNIYIIRQRFYRNIHNFWSIYYIENNRYYYELNSKRKNDVVISNFYYLTRKQYKGDELINISILQYNPIIYYFFNKICYSRYPYLYWTYVLPYNKYEYTDNAETNTHHIRTYFFITFLYFIKNKILKFKNYSYFSFTFISFKGLQNIFLKKYKGSLKKIPLKKDNVRNKIEKKKYLYYTTFLQKMAEFFDLNVLKTPFSFYNTINHLQEKIVLINIIKYNVFKKSFMENNSLFFVVKWYNKLQFIVNTSKNYTTSFYIRSSKHFNKGRYSRNRQLYRTGVYWCVWLNIILVYGLYFYFYRFIFSFGYFWFPIGILVLSFFGSKLFKYRFYSINTLINEFIEFFNFVYIYFLKVKLYIYEIFPKVFTSKVDFTNNYFFLIHLYLSTKIFNIKTFFNKVFEKTKKK